MKNRPLIDTWPDIRRTIIALCISIVGSACASDDKPPPRLSGRSLAGLLHEWADRVGVQAFDPREFYKQLTAPH